jgi:hypothetical protein
MGRDIHCGNAKFIIRNAIFSLVGSRIFAKLSATLFRLAFLMMNFALPQWMARRVPWRQNDVLNAETAYLRSPLRQRKVHHQKRHLLLGRLEDLREAICHLVSLVPGDRMTY